LQARNENVKWNVRIQCAGFSWPLVRAITKI